MKVKFAIIVSILIAAILVLTSCSLITGGTVVDPNDSCGLLEGSAKDNCYFESQQCSKVKDAQFRDSCVAELAKLKDDVKVCGLIVDEKTKGFCQQQIALQQDNFELCKEISDFTWQDTCFYNLAVKHENVDQCSYISVLERNIDCVKKVAIAANDVDLCDRLSKQNRAECIFKIATQTLDSNICVRFAENKLDLSTCYLRLAKLTDNKTLCNKITINDIKNSCTSHFNENK